jgi:hypothetical protein
MYLLHWQVTQQISCHTISKQSRGKYVLAKMKTKGAEQEVLGRIQHLHAFDITWSSQNNAFRDSSTATCVFIVTVMLLQSCFLAHTDTQSEDRISWSISGCRPRGPGFDSRRCQIFWVALGLEQGPHSPCEEKWGATLKKSSDSGL